MNDYFVERDKCPCCKSSDHVLLCRSSYTEAPLQDYLISFYSTQGTIEFRYLGEQDYVLVECLGCGMIYQREIPGEVLMYKLYEEWIDPRTVFELVEKRRSIGYYTGLISEVIRIIRQFDRPPMELQFLDFGMGWGHWCRAAQAFGCTVYGTELSTTRIEYAKQLGVRTLNSEEISKIKFDFINAEQVFEHLADPRETLISLKKSLNTDGILRISVPDGSDIKKRLVKWNWYAPKDSSWSLNPVAPLEHINCFNRNSLIRLACECGLVPMEIPPLSLQIYSGGLLNQIKTILKPYNHRLRGVQRSICIFFRPANE